MIKGISEADVAKRRSAFGWNELESPSENMFIKFLGFFKGPILYGECARTMDVFVELYLTSSAFYSNGIGRHFGWWSS
jgi:hypothetical protein